MSLPPFEFSPLPERKKWRWQNGRGLAAWVVVNIEHFEFGKLGTAIQPHLTSLPEIANYGWRDYGNRVGIWRMFEMFDRFPQIKVTAALNADICRYYPQIVEAALQRGWELMAHGPNNSTGQAHLSPTEESQLIGDTLATIESFSGKRPVGWLTPGFSVTQNTPALLHQAGVHYLADWVNDDQPFYVRFDGGQILSVPYTLETNDITLCLSNRYSGKEFQEAVCDQFDQLYRDSESASRVFCLALHPFIVGQPLRLPYLEASIAHLTKHHDVWFATGAEIAGYFATLS
jgi:allantoinase